MTVSSDRPLVTFIIPAYNQEAYIAQAVESVFAQDYRPLQVIVMNDGSKDGTAGEVKKLLAKYPELEYYEKPNSGVCRTCNAGLRHAKGEFVIRLDGDDYVPADYCSKLMACMEEAPENVAYVYCDAHYCGEREGVMSAAPFNYPRLVTENYIHVSALVRTAAAREVGYYNPNMIYSFEDWDLWLSLSEHGYVGAYCRDTFLYYRQRAEPSRNKMRTDQVRATRAQIQKNHPGIYGRPINRLRIFLWRSKWRLRRILGIGG